MGQSGIHIMNKTGYSMFWSSMWDNKILYTRMLKENIFLNKFFDLSFRDSLSVNLLDFKDKSFNYSKKKFQIVDIKKSSLYKHINNVNKIKYYSTKIWILRFQKWIILYHFIFITDFNKLNFNPYISEDESYYDNFFYLISFYRKCNKNLNFYFLRKKTPKLNIF